MPRPKGFVPSPETRAKTSATLKARIEGEAGKAERERLMRHLDKARQAGAKGGRPRTRPPVGTQERRLFKKVADIIGAAATHAEFGRGASGQ